MAQHSFQGIVLLCHPLRPPTIRHHSFSTHILRSFLENSIHLLYQQHSHKQQQPFQCNFLAPSQGDFLQQAIHVFHKSEFRGKTEVE